MILAAIIALLFASGLFSASETAFVTASRSKCTVRARKRGLGARAALHFFDRPEQFFTTVLVGNNIVNTAATSLAALVLLEYGWSDTAILAATTIVILLFGEMMPKAFSRVMADFIVDPGSLFIKACYWPLFPIIWAVKTASEQIIRIFHAEPSIIQSFFDKKDFAIILHESERSGAMNSEERTQISKAVALSEVMIKDVMVPRTDVVAVEESSSVDEAVTAMLHNGYSKLFVYRENMDNIVGVVIGRDLFLQPARLSEVVHPVIVVPTTGNCSDLFRTFREKNISLAVVVDEFGGTAGIVTSTDVLRQVLGDIMEDGTDDALTVKRLSDGSFLVAGSADADDIMDHAGVFMPDGPFDTVAGYLLFKLGRIPLERETVQTEIGTVTIVKATKTRIEFIRLKPAHDTASA